MSRETPAVMLGVAVSRVRRWFSWIWQLEAQFKGVEFKGRADFLGRAIISVAKGGRIIVGDGVCIGSSVRANPLALPHPSVLRAMVSGSEVVLGPKVGMSGTVLCAAARIEVGEGTIFGSGAMVIDNDFHVPEGEWGWSMDSNICGKVARPITIGRGVFVGARAIVLKGVTIGDRAVVGAGAVVSKDVPARHIAVGNPARMIPLKEASAAAV